MTKKYYFVDDPLDCKVHKFRSFEALMEFLNGTDFDCDPYEEVRVFEAVEIKPKTEWHD